MPGLSERCEADYGVPFPPMFARDSAAAMLASMMMSCLRITMPPSVRRSRIEGRRRRSRLPTPRLSGR